MENKLLEVRVVFVRDYFVYMDMTKNAKPINYKGLVGKVVAINPYKGAVSLVVCPENLTVPMTSVDVSYLQLVKEESILVQEKVLSILKEVNIFSSLGEQDGED